MSGKPAEQDNSIEEILASIRQIISEDDPKPAEAEPSPPPPPPAEVADAAAVDDIFELVDRVVAEEDPAPVPEPVFEAPKEEIEVDLRDSMPEPEPVQPMPPPQPRAPQPMPAYEPEGPMFTDNAAAATLGAFSALSETILVERQRAMANAGNVTLEDIVKELLAPLMRQWIDQHVPSIVERLLREELDKIARQAREG
jgi:uncharacterized protein